MDKDADDHECFLDRKTTGVATIMSTLKRSSPILCEDAIYAQHPVGALLDGEDLVPGRQLEHEAATVLHKPTKVADTQESHLRTDQPNMRCVG
jgi:hypothetical protein